MIGNRFLDISMPAYDPGKWVLFPRLSFLDNFRPQITMVQGFLVSQELHVWGDNQAHGGAWRIGIARAESVYKAAMMMRPYLHKKREEIVAIIDYLESRITATRVVEVFNESVRKGNRTGKISPVDIPYTRKEGQLLRRAEMVENIAISKAKNGVMAAEIAELVRKIVFSNGMAEEEAVKRIDTSTANLTRRLRWGSIHGG
jgi:hypothetical protein